MIVTSDMYMNMHEKLFFCDLPPEFQHAEQLIWTVVHMHVL